MRRLLSYFSIAAMLFACGEAGVGFNLSKNLPVEIPVSFPTSGFPAPLPGVNPPASPTISDSYDLSDLGEDVDNIPEILINQLSFEIADVSTAEEIALDELSIDLVLSDGSKIALVPSTYTTLADTGAPIVVLDSDNAADQVQLEALATTLLQDKSLGFEIVFDFAEIPTTDLDFTYKLYFDVTAKVRFN